MDNNDLLKTAASGEDEPEYCFNFQELSNSNSYYNENYVLGYRNGIIYSDKNWKFKPNSVFKLPDDVKMIAQGAFYENNSISGVILPEGLEVIEMGAFSRCANLKKITIPKSVTRIGRNPFEYCSKLQSIEADPDNPNYRSVDGCLYDKEMTTLIAVPGAATRVEIPYGVSVIAPMALYGCLFLSEIVIPESVTRIEDHSFCDTYALQEIQLPSKLTHIGINSFSRCSIKELVIPASVTEIGAYAFFACQELVSVEIPEGVKRIEKETFHWCTALTDVTLPQSLEGIGESAFKACSSLPGIKIPSGVKSIGAKAFDFTSLFKKWNSVFIILGGGVLYEYRSDVPDVVLPDSVRIIGPAFSDAYLLRSIIIPEGVVRIDNKAFLNCTSLSEIVLPKSLRSIGAYAFYNCADLSKIHINEGLEEIGEGAFERCNFKELTLPGTLKRIGRAAFSSCNLSRLIIPPGVEIIDDGAFADNALEYVKIPASVSKIGTNPFAGRSRYIRIELDEANPYYRMIDGCLCTADGKKLVIALPNVTANVEGSSRRKRYLTRVVIPDSITEICKFAFVCFKVFAANLPIELYESKYSDYYAKNYMRLYKAGDPFFEKTHEANNAFIRANFDKILRVMNTRDSEAVRYMANEGLLDLYSTDFCLQLFEEDVEITAILLDYRNSRFSREYLEAYEEEEFRKDIGVTERTPEEWKRFFSFEEKGGGCCITGYFGIKKDVTVPGYIGNMQVENIAKESFSPKTDDRLSEFVKKARSNIRSVIITDGVLNISERAFSDCDNLSEVVLPDGLLTIRNGAFVNCPRLTEITIPDSVCFISSAAFYNSVTIKGTKDSYGIAYAKHYDLKYEII